jgi:hypothetical protein
MPVIVAQQTLPLGHVSAVQATVTPMHAAPGSWHLAPPPPPSQQTCGGLQTACPHGSGPPETTGPPLLPVLLLVAPDELPELLPEEPPELPELLPPELPPELPEVLPPELPPLDPDEPLLPPSSLVAVDVAPPHATAMAIPAPQKVATRILAVLMKASSAVWSNVYLTQPPRVAFA